MRTILVAIHGIMTNQTDASWPDKLDAEMYHRDPEVKVIKKEYRAGPFPRWNCLVKDPALARSLANELELFLVQSSKFKVQGSTVPLGSPSPGGEGRGEGESLCHTLDFRLQTLDLSPALWFVAHSNGAVIALLTAKILIDRGYKIAGLILTGAACEADLAKNGIANWLRPRPASDPQLSTLNHQPSLGAAIAYCSHDDAVLAGDPRAVRTHSTASQIFQKLRAFLWGRLIAPYGCLGRTGWLSGGKPIQGSRFKVQGSTVFGRLLTRWYKGGHSTYFTPENIDRTFDQIYHDIVPASHATRNTHHAKTSVAHLPTYPLTH